VQHLRGYTLLLLRLAYSGTHRGCSLELISAFYILDIMQRNRRWGKAKNWAGGDMAYGERHGGNSQASVAIWPVSINVISVFLLCQYQQKAVSLSWLKVSQLRLKA